MKSFVRELSLWWAEDEGVKLFSFCIPAIKWQYPGWHRLTGRQEGGMCLIFQRRVSIKIQSLTSSPESQWGTLAQMTGLAYERALQVVFSCVKILRSFAKELQRKPAKSPEIPRSNTSRSLLHKIRKWSGEAHLQSAYLSSSCNSSLSSSDCSRPGSLVFSLQD